MNLISLFKTCLRSCKARRTRQTEEQLNKPETQTNAQAKERTNEKPGEQMEPTFLGFS